MGVDHHATGTKYIRLAEQAGLIEVDRKPAEDKRKHLLRPTAKLKEILDQELSTIAGLSQ